MKENESKKFDQNAYIKAYKKEKYKEIKVLCKPSEAEEVANYCKMLNISKSQLLIQSALYCIHHDMIEDIQAEYSRRKA